MRSHVSFSPQVWVGPENSSGRTIEANRCLPDLAEGGKLANRALSRHVVCYRSESSRVTGHSEVIPDRRALLADAFQQIDRGAVPQTNWMSRYRTSGPKGFPFVPPTRARNGPPFNRRKLGATWGSNVASNPISPVDGWRGALHFRLSASTE